MSRAPSISQLLKQAGLVRRPRAGRPPAAASGTRTRGRKRSRLGDTIDSGSTGDSNVVNDKGEEKEEEGNGETASSTLGSGDSGIDDQIAALERELEGGSTGINASGSDDSDDSDEDGDSSGSEREDHDEPSENGTRSNGVANGRKKRAHKIVSPLDSEKIQPLPAHLLPRPGCGVAKSNKSLKKSKKRPRVDVDTPSGSATPGPSRGLDSAVKELMANYEARSSERVPFYCRVCQFQGESIEALQRHKEEPLHLEATKKERKISACSLCKKQFTSPPQLKEHLAGKAHMERLQATMSRQGKWVPGGSGGGSDYGGKFNSPAGILHETSWSRGGSRGRGRGGRGRGRGGGMRIERGRRSGRGY